MANILFAKQLQAIFDKDNIKALSISLHPGGVATGRTSSRSIQTHYHGLIKSLDGSIKMVGKDYLASLDGVLSPMDGAITCENPIEDLSWRADY